MDFAALMSKEISKGKPSNPTTSNHSKYLKRSEVEAAREAAYQAEQEAIEREREQRAAKKRKVEDDEADRNRSREEKKRKLAEESAKRRTEEEDRKEWQRRKRLGLPDLPPKGEDGKEDAPLAEGEEDVEEEELILKLRQLGEPVTLFGETHKARLRRYRRLLQRSSTPQQQLTTGPIPTSLELVPEAEMKVPEKLPPKDDTKARGFLFRQLASYFTMVLTEWQVALARREGAVKESFSGKQAESAYLQSRENMRPLFKKFEKGELEESILEPVVEIVRAAQGRRYVDANDGYLRLSIGKA